MNFDRDLSSLREHPDAAGILAQDDAVIEVYGPRPLYESDSGYQMPVVEPTPEGDNNSFSKSESISGEIRGRRFRSKEESKSESQCDLDRKSLGSRASDCLQDQRQQYQKSTPNPQPPTSDNRTGDSLTASTEVQTTLQHFFSKTT